MWKKYQGKTARLKLVLQCKECEDWFSDKVSKASIKNCGMCFPCRTINDMNIYLSNIPSDYDYVNDPQQIVSHETDTHEVLSHLFLNPLDKFIPKK